MLTIRGADQVCTSLRAARGSLMADETANKPRIEELDSMIGELAVGTPTYRGDGQKSKAGIERLIATLAPAAGTTGDPHANADDGASPRETASASPMTHMKALEHLRRAVATLQRLDPPPATQR